MFKNITLKKTIASFLIMLIVNTPCMAANWVTITAENGKSADLDLDSIKMAVDTVEYDIRTEKDEFVFVNRLSTELYEKGTPTALILSTKYKDSRKISSEKYDERHYRELKSGTLQAEIFDVLSKDLSARKFDKGQNTWEKYLKKQKNKMTRQWKPGSFKHLNSAYIDTTTYKTPVYHSVVELKVDQYGTVKERKPEDYYLNEVTKLDPLPDDYSGKTFTISVDMNYYKYIGKNKTKKPLVTQVSPTKAVVKISKNNRPPVIGNVEYGLLKALNADWVDGVLKIPVLGFILALPMIFVELAGKLPILILFLITGGDWNDVH